MEQAGKSATILSLQVLRAVAAFMVVAHHFFEYPRRYLTEWPETHVGAAGVDIFFVISGVVMALTTARDQFDPWHFLRKRVWRIVPLYWLITTLVLAMLLSGMSPLGLHSWNAWDVAASYLFQPSTHGPILVVGWTLNFEMLFYVFVAATAFIAGQRRRTAVLAIMLTCLCLAGFVLGVRQGTGATSYAELLLNSLLIEFLAGFLLGRFYLSNAASGLSRDWLNWAGWLAGAASLVLFALAATVDTMPEAWRIVVFGLPSVLLCMSALLLEKGGLALRSRTLLFLGDASFAVYLTHPLIGQTFEKLSVQFLPQTPVNIILALGGAVAATVLISAALHLWVERPMQAFGRSWVDNPSFDFMTARGRKRSIQTSQTV